ncbi:MAG: HvfC family RiPP maturation protein [Cellvibrionaceae bacterium]
MSSSTDFRQTQKQFANFLRDPEVNPAPADIEARRMKIYQDLIFKNIEGFLSGGFPILRSLYNESDWNALARDFIRGHESHSPYFLEISQEFLKYLQQERGPHDCDPAFLQELAHYEWVELALDVSEETLPVTGDQVLTEDLLAQQPLVSPLVWSLSYQYPVHQLGPEYQPLQPPEQPTFLLVYRDRHDSVQFMVSNALTVRLLNLLEGDESLTGEQALRQLAAEMNHPAPDDLVKMGLDLLIKLQKCDIVF